MVRTLATGDTRLDLPDTSGRTVLHLAAMMTQETGIIMANCDTYNDEISRISSQY